MARKKKADENDMAAMFAEDAKKSKTELPSKKKLSELSSLVSQLVDYEEQIKEAEDDLKFLKEKFAELQTKKIPDFFDEIGLSRLDLTDGAEIIIVRKFVGGITAKNKDKCHKWLAKNGHEALIKHDVITKLKKEEKKEHKELIKILDKLKVTYQDKEYVHPSTINAFINEQMTAGSKFPEKLFNVFPLRFAKINTK